MTLEKTISHPGTILKEYVGKGKQFSSMTALAKHVGVSSSTISRFVNGEKRMSPGFAKKIEATMGISTQTWKDAEKAYAGAITPEKVYTRLQMKREWFNRTEHKRI